MNRAWLALWAASLLAVAGEPSNSPPRDELVFRNGDFVYGKLLAVTPSEILQWRHPEAAGPISFTLDSVEEVAFGGAAKKSDETGGCKVLFSDGDLLRGKFAACDAESVTLDVSGAGRLKLPRSRLQSLVVMSADPPLFDGFTGMEGWTEVSSPVGLGGEAGHWTYRDGAFYASKAASLARDLKLPDLARIEFDLSWHGQPNLAIALYTDSLQPILLLNKENGPDFGGFYSFRLSGIVADIFAIRKQGQIPSLGSVILSAMDKTNHAHFDFRISKPQNRIILLVDKTPVMQWSDPKGFEGEGTGIRFVENSGAIKLSNLRVTRWDGILEEKPEVGGSATEDVVWLQNGESHAGVVSAITPQTVTLRAQGANQSIPFAKVREINFMAPSNRPPTDPPGVRVLCGAGGSIHGQLESWGPDGVVLRSPNFGRAKFDPAMFAALQFLRTEGN
jgi:hypothetical protein